MILYARRKDSVLIKPGLADWVQHPPVSDTERVHQAQKPVVLLRDLISRSVYPNSILYDPFCGSAATLEAGLEERLVVKGCEMLKEAYDAGRTQIIKYQQRKDGKE
jgi:DNA modification methylase